MFELDSEDRFSNWGAASSFSVRSNGASKAPSFSKPGAGNIYRFNESSSGSNEEGVSLKKSFNLFGNSSSLAKLNPWSQIDTSLTQSEVNGKSQVENTSLPSALHRDGDIHGHDNTQDKLNVLRSEPPPTNLTIHRKNGIATFSIEKSNTSPLSPVPHTSNTSAHPKSRLGKLFSYFKRENKDKVKVPSIFKTPNVTPKMLSNPSYKAIDTRRTGSMRRLILKTKPIKYHLIDVNKVLSSKRGVAVNVSANKLLTQALDENGVQDVEEEVEYKPFNATVNDQSKQDVETNNLVEDKEENEESSVQKYNGYWTYPSIDQLSQMEPSSLEEVHNFIIGRVGYGQIAYDYPVDLTSVVSRTEENGTLIAEELFDNIVILKQSAVLVYKDVQEKPPLGSGLNVPATITLEGIKPKPSLSMEEHINFLKRQIGMEFVTYDPITHIWVFKVKHFSVWGLVDEEDQSQRDLVLLKRKQDLREAEALAEYSKVYSDSSFDQEVKKQKLNEYSKAVPGGWGSAFPPDDSLLKLKRSLVTDEIAEVLNRYRELEDDTMAGKVGGITIDSDSDEVEEIDEVKLNAYEPVITDVTAFDEIRNKTTYPTTDNWLLQLELANQYNSAMAPMAPDRDFSKGALTMSKVDEVLFAQNEKGNKTGDKDFKRSKVPLKDIAEKDIQSIIDTLINECEFTKLSNLMPQLETKGLTFAKFVNKNDKSLHALQIELASILFDKTDESNVERLELLGKWLQKYNESQIADLLEEHKLDDLYCIFLYLCVEKYEEAIDRALKSKNDHLAAILSVAGADDQLVKALCLEQVEIWQQERWKEFIPKSLVMIYQLLAGQIDKVSNNLSWSIVMGIHLYYGDVQSINDVIDSLKSSLPEDDSTADMFRLFVNGVNYSSVLSSSLSSAMKWLFCLVLADSNDDSLAVCLGDSLENAGLWKEALAVFTSIKDENSKAELIRNLVITKTEEEYIGEHDEKYLTTVLKVPRSLIHEAKALERENAGDYWSQVNAYMEVDLWSKAHETIVSHLGPQTVIKNSAVDIDKLLKVIDQFPQHGSIIPSWNKGAGIYQNYFKLIHNTNDTEVIVFLIEFLPATKPQTAEERLAINIIAKFVGDLALENKQLSDTQRQKLLSLPLDNINKGYFQLRLSRN